MVGISDRLSLRFARSRCQVLLGIPGDPGSRGCEVSATPPAQSKLECFCGALGAIGQRGVPVQADFVRGNFFEESASPIPRALSYRTQSPGEGERSVIPLCRGTAEESGGIDRVSGAPRRSSQVLPPAGRMSFLTERGLIRQNISGLVANGQYTFYVW